MTVENLYGFVNNVVSITWVPKSSKLRKSKMRAVGWRPWQSLPPSDQGCQLFVPLLRHQVFIRSFSVSSAFNMSNRRSKEHIFPPVHPTRVFSGIHESLYDLECHRNIMRSRLLGCFFLTRRFRCLIFFSAFFCSSLRVISVTEICLFRLALSVFKAASINTESIASLFECVIASEMPHEKSL